MQDICNKFIEVIFLWDVWFLGQIVYSKIEQPLIINKMALTRSFTLIVFPLSLQISISKFVSISARPHQFIIEIGQSLQNCSFSSLK